MCAAQGLPTVCAMSPKTGKKGNLNHCVYTRKKSWLLTSLGCLPSELVRHWGSTDPDSQVWCKEAWKEGNADTVAEENLCFHWCHGLYFGCICLHVEENPLTEKRGFIVCYFIRNFKKFFRKKRREEQANLDENSESIQIKLL